MRRTTIPGVHNNTAQSLDPTQVLLQDAVAALSALKRKHRTLFESDPKQFRLRIKKAESRVLSLKRGPKPDPAISSAAREVAAGMRIEEAFQNRYPSNLVAANEQLYGLALESFRTKVNAHIRRHPYLKRLRKKHRNPSQNGI